MKKNTIICAAAVACVALAVASCDKSQPQVEAASETKQASTELRIAYIESDSIVNQYQFCKESTLDLEKKSQNIQNTLSAKEKELNAAAANFQKKYESNGFSSREEAASQQAAIQRQSNDLQALQARLTNEMQQKTEEYNKALHDSVQHFLAVYNKDKKYSLILTKGGMVDNILYADKAMDITNEVVAGLNKAYKPAKKAEEKPAEKKEEKK